MSMWLMRRLRGGRVSNLLVTHLAKGRALGSKPKPIIWIILAFMFVSNLGYIIKILMNR